MKILLISTINHNKLVGFKSNLEALNHEVYFYENEEFEQQYTYIGKKIYKLGFKFLKDNYNNKNNLKIINTFLELKPDLVFVVNGERIYPETLDYIKKKTKIIVWLIDSIKRDFMANSLNNLYYYDKVFVFEKTDILFLNKYGIKAQYTPVGYNNQIYYPNEKKRNIDITFIGMPSENRYFILREVANYVYQHHLSMKIYGRWHNEHIWKKWQFKKREPILGKYLINMRISPEKVADLYRQSKICLNIHISEHNGINPRTFEILGTKSFQLMDKRNDYYGLIRPNIDLIIYENTDDLINKIDYYLKNGKEREQISNSGYEWVKDKLTMSNCLQSILKTFSDLD